MGFRIRHKITGLLAVLVILSGPAVLTAEAQENISAIQFPYPFPMTLLAPASDTVNICIIGDVMMHSKQIDEAAKDNGKYDFSSYFKHIAKDIHGADISIANMEFTLAGEPYSGYPCFSAPDELAGYLADCGFDVFLTANNHILDKGTAGLKRTLDIYRRLGTSHGILTTGCAESPEEMQATSPLKICSKGISINILNLTYGTNVGAGAGWYAVNRLTDKESILKALDRCHEDDVTLVVPHWGEEYTLKHSSGQESTARWLIDNGADLIIGAHPHVIQDTQNIDGVHVAYSLGNAVSNMSAANTQLGLMAMISIVRHHNGKIELLPPQYKYLWCSRPGGFCSQYTVLPVSRFIGTRGSWQGPWEYDKMMATYERVKNATGIEETKKQ